ncbi:MAG: YdcH family protein [Polyangiaceae bacterium]|nr:YdcH family protein [Polyangiaceae bacterium]
MKQRLLLSDVSPEARLLDAESRHRQLDVRLKELGRRAYLTPTEQLEASELKKLKLRAKDELTTLRSKLGP